MSVEQKRIGPKRVEEMNYFELLAWLGIGSSHPGGFPATRQNLETIKITPEETVLDVGCGSGLTACHLAKTTGCHVTGIDINAQMIEKASLRAGREGVAPLTEFKTADAYQLPFADHSFDWVLCESITVFLDKVKVYREFLRVLKPQGRIADLEMALLAELPPPLQRQLQDCFGAGVRPLSYTEWTEALTAAGFENAEIKNPQPLKDNRTAVVNELKNDWVLVKDLMTKAYAQPALVPRLRKNANFIKKNRSYFGYGLICGQKPEIKAEKPQAAKGFKRFYLYVKKHICFFPRHKIFY